VLEGIRAGIAGEAHDAPQAVRTDARSPEVSSLQQARARRAGRPSRAVQWVGAAAAAALVLSLGAWNLALRDDRDASQQYGDRLAARVRDLARRTARACRSRPRTARSSPSRSCRTARVSLVVDGLEPNSSGTSYVLWAQDRTGGVRPVGAFDVEQAQVDVVGTCRSRGAWTR
jgi:hypothetical protein